MILFYKPAASKFLPEWRKNLNRYTQGFLFTKEREGIWTRKKVSELQTISDDVELVGFMAYTTSIEPLVFCNPDIGKSYLFIHTGTTFTYFNEGIKHLNALSKVLSPNGLLTLIRNFVIDTDDSCLIFSDQELELSKRKWIENNGVYFSSSEFLYSGAGTVNSHQTYPRPSSNTASDDPTKIQCDGFALAVPSEGMLKYFKLEEWRGMVMYVCDMKDNVRGFLPLDFIVRIGNNTPKNSEIIKGAVASATSRNIIIRRFVNLDPKFPTTYNIFTHL